jgi:hypothetical protein
MWMIPKKHLHCRTALILLVLIIAAPAASAPRVEVDFRSRSSAVQLGEAAVFDVFATVPTTDARSVHVSFRFLPPEHFPATVRVTSHDSTVDVFQTSLYGSASLPLPPGRTVSKPVHIATVHVFASAPGFVRPLVYGASLKFADQELGVVADTWTRVDTLLVTASPSKSYAAFLAKRVLFLLGDLWLLTLVAIAVCLLRLTRAPQGSSKLVLRQIPAPFVILSIGFAAPFNGSDSGAQIAQALVVTGLGLHAADVFTLLKFRWKGSRLALAANCAPLLYASCIAAVVSWTAVSGLTRAA